MDQNQRQMPRDILLTPGPVTTADVVRHAMQRDLGSREQAFREVTQRVRKKLLSVAGAGQAWTVVPLQGSGTFAIEAGIGTLVGREGVLLVLMNGAYGRRMAEIARRIGRRVICIEDAENQPHDPGAIDACLQEHPEVTHVAVVHCETTSGLLNPLQEIGGIVERRGRRLFVDAMSSFGALPISATSPIDAIVSSSNKCIQGLPGVAFCIVRTDALERSAGNCHSVALDLHAQWVALETTGEWRFTPPVQVMLALDRALDLLSDEGGVDARLARYRANHEVLDRGMQRLGFTPFLSDSVRAPIIATYREPSGFAFEFETFAELVRSRGYILYPGKVTAAKTFRVGCIGDVGPQQLTGAVQAIEEALDEMRVGAAKRFR
jgi:2-aminoethylphosphonate-pyruvate transaminase